MSRKKIYKVEVGEKFHWYDRDLWHIVNIFNEGQSTLVVLKSWSKYKNRWCYQVTGKGDIEWWFQSECFKEVN